jgi:hypothetical protein
MLRRTCGVLGLAGLVAIGGLVGRAGDTGAATRTPSTAICGSSDVYVNSGGGHDVLASYTPAGKLVSSVPLATDYGDIAFNATGTTLYGIRFNAPDAVIDTINPTTGAVTATFTATGPASTDIGYNGLTALPDGTLLAGGFNDNALYDINPSTGVSTDFRAHLPTGFVSGGDYDTLADGDILALTLDPNNPSVSTLVRIHENNTDTVVGTVPNSFGMAQSGGRIYLAGADGVIRSMSTVPTAQSDSLLTTTTVVSTGLALYGATADADANRCVAPTPDTPTGGRVAATPEGAGYWSLNPRGTLSEFGNAADLGSENGDRINAPVVGINSTTTGRGYWLVGSDGGVYAFGDAHFYGSLANRHLNAPVVGLARTQDNGGYWLVAADGGVFGFGDAHFYGSLGRTRLNQPVTGIASNPVGGGYWLAAADGGVFSFGDAHFHGSMGGINLNKQVDGIAATPDGQGYWLIAADGGVFTFGDSGFFGSMGATGTTPISGIVVHPNSGYRLIGTEGAAHPFGT